MKENVPREIQELISASANLEKLIEIALTSSELAHRTLAVQRLTEIAQSYSSVKKGRLNIQTPDQVIDSILLKIVFGDYPIELKTVAVKGISNCEKLFIVFAERHHYKIRLAALDKLSDTRLLKKVITTDKSRTVRESATRKYKELKKVANSWKKPASTYSSLPEGNRLVFIDTETTGLTASDRVCQVSALVYDGRDLTPYSDYCNPHCKMNPFAYRVHHIPQELVDAAPDLCETQTYQIIMQHNTAGNIFVFHNAPFDIRMLSYNGFRLKAPVIDTLSIAKRHKCFPSNSLSSIVAYLNLNTNKMKSHEALGDATMTFQLFNWLCRKYPSYMNQLLASSLNPDTADEFLILIQSSFI